MSWVRHLIFWRQPTPRRIERRDTVLIGKLRAAQLEQGAPWAGLLLAVIVIMLIAFGIWAHRTRLDEVTVGAGRVVPSSREQRLQSVEGGVLEQLLVKEGQLVESGQVVARIDDGKLVAGMREGEVRAAALHATAVRLRAEMLGFEPKFPAELMQGAAAQVADQMAAWRTRQQTLNEILVARNRALSLLEDELRITAPLVEKGLVSQVEVLRMERQIAETRGQIEEARNRFRADAAADLSRVEGELKALRESNSGRAGQVKNALLRSPVRGVVKNIAITTKGAAIRPGEEIMQIVPADDQLQIAVKILPADVAFLRPGQRATVKLQAYDYSIYGALEGVVESISPDTLQDEVRRDLSYYQVIVKTRTSVLYSRSGKELPVIPGMTATVDILTGSKTVIDYLLKPVLKAREAMRER